MSDRYKDARLNFHLRKTMTPQQIADMYNDFAEEYEEKHLALGLRSHFRIREYMADIYPEDQRAALRVLDVGAGTGLVGEVLSELGFVRVDALDPAEKMLDIAKTKNIYQRLICAFLNKDRIDEIETGIETLVFFKTENVSTKETKYDICTSGLTCEPAGLVDQYDCITAAGAFNEGLIPLCAFQEMIRIVKPGGRIVFTITDKYIQVTDGYRNDLLPFIQKMADEGVWDVTAVPLADGAIHLQDGPGTLYSFKVNVTEKNL